MLLSGIQNFGQPEAGFPTRAVSGMTGHFGDDGITFVISALFTGLAGILWVPLNGLTTPEVLYWPFSGEIVFMAVLGGFANFFGPLIGAFTFIFLKSELMGVTQYWRFWLGVTLVVIVVVFPRGLVGLGQTLWAKLRRS